MLSSDPALEFFKIRPNIDKAGAEIKVQVKNLGVMEKKKNKTKTNQPCWKLSQGKQMATYTQKNVLLKAKQHFFNQNSVVMMSSHWESHEKCLL